MGSTGTVEIMVDSDHLHIVSLSTLLFSVTRIGQRRVYRIRTFKTFLFSTLVMPSRERPVPFPRHFHSPEPETQNTNTVI